MAKKSPIMPASPWPKSVSDTPGVAPYGQNKPKPATSMPFPGVSGPIALPRSGDGKDTKGNIKGKK